MIGVERIAHFLFLARCNAAIDEFVVDLFLDEHARAGAAALPLIEEQGEMRAFDGLRPGRRRRRRCWDSCRPVRA